MKKLIPVICSIALVVVFTESGSPQQQKSPPRVFTVTGSGWETCGQWKNAQIEFKIGYVIGHVEANTQVTGILHDIPEADAIRESFDPPPGLQTGDYMKALDSFCSDPYNTKISVANAMGFAKGTLIGGPPPDDKILAHLRCLGAAGADADRIRDCNKN